MDLNNDDIENEENLSKPAEILVQFICCTLFCLPLFVILKIKIYDPYFSVFKGFLKNLFS